MKSYNEIADSIFERRDKYIAQQKAKRKIIIRTVTSLCCICLIALIGFGIWQSGSLNNSGLPLEEQSVNHFNESSDSSNSIVVKADQQDDNTNHAVFIPPIELPETSDGAIYDMIGLVVYNGNIYTQAQSYEYSDANKIADLVGDYLGYATGEIDEWSNEDAYSEEFASTYTGNVYSVKGYSTDFRICISSEYVDESGYTVKWIQFLERLNGIGLTDGEDLFGDRLNIKDRIASIQYQTHEDWNQAKNFYKNLTGLTEEQINAFIEELYAGKFEYAYETYPDIYDDSSLEQAHLYLHLDDNTDVEIRLIEGGYVGYQDLGWYFVKMPGEAFDTIFYACK